MIKAEINFSKWIRQFSAAEIEISKINEKVFQSATRDLYNKIISYTPVGDPSLWNWPAPANYHPGTLKKSWTLELQKGEVTISNNQPYAVRVEDGWSSQAPSGMMRRANREFPDLLNATRYKFS